MGLTTLTTRTTCRICGSENLAPVLDLGEQKIASGFGPNAPQRAIPLMLIRCEDCSLVQLQHSVPPALLYSDYWYRSGVNRTMTAHLHSIAREAEQWTKVPRLAIDIGCNDGTLLDGYSPQTKRIGFDPSDAAEEAIAKGHRVHRDRFTAASPNVWFGAEIITSIAMIYDLEDPRAFMAKVAKTLAPDGIWVIECHYLPTMLAHHQYDAICHEHLEYYSLAVLERLVDEQGLNVMRAELNDINGGSIRLVVGRRRPGAEDARAIQKLRLAEFELGLDTAEPYVRFAVAVRNAVRDLAAFCADVHREGKTIHVYGASTKGNVILQAARLGADVIDYAAERNPAKYGLQTATGIPIIAEQASRELAPDYYLVLPWHFREEFIERERDYLRAGGSFIWPLPQVHVSTGELVAA